jgi:Tol biopolymer transport system component
VAHDVVGGPAPLGHSIYVTDVKRGESNLLTGAEGGNDASWSPNGKIIAFDRAAVGDPNIYTVPANGGTPTLVRENAVDPEWSNNSKRLVFRDFTDNSVRTVDLNGGSETVVATSGFNPSWSPNGKYIAFTDGDNIFKISVKQSGEPKGIPVQLTNDGANHQPSWSNNSKTIVFHSNRVSGDEDIWTISAYGETPSLLAGLADYGDFDPSYLKNGKYVAYAGFTSVNSSNSQKNETTVSTSRSSVPTQFSLNQNFPNPFNPSTLIQYTIPNASNVKIEIFNITGESVATLVDGFKNEGYYEVSFNASDLPSGMYLYRISAGTFVQTRKMILLR